MIDAKTILLDGQTTKAIPINVAIRETWAKPGKARPAQLTAWAKSNGFEAAPLSILLVPDAKGVLASVWVGAPLADADPFALGALASRLPEGSYAFAKPPANADLVALGWALELYKYDPHRPTKLRNTKLVCPKGVARAEVIAKANAVAMVRDLVNAPTNVMGPDALEAAARSVAKLGKATFKVIKGDKLKKGFPLIHTVGAAAEQEPRLVDFTWGNPRHPKITLVGKGVCFDTGGLDIKPSSGMLLMKKDMGGAANMLGLAQLIMQAKLPIRLRVLLPIVENSISDEAFRPGDVFKSRKGLTVEIGNTDAEGRLILADALALADEETPELLIDFATLTGAARVALGPDLPPVYTDDAALATSLVSHSMKVNDPLWQLPLWRPYYSMIETPIADLNNNGQGGFAGSITAALFLRRFVEKAKSYAHVDIYAWVPTAKPGRPKGGESQAMRAVFSYLQERYGT
jgi:leucyl aminopeptidase